jgi:hypothetical protein
MIYLMNIIVVIWDIGFLFMTQQSSYNHFAIFNNTIKKISKKLEMICVSGPRCSGPLGFSPCFSASSPPDEQSYL